MKELGASNMEGAARPLNPVIPISLQPAQMPTGYTHWIGELLEKWWSVIAKRKKTLQDRSFRTTGMKNLKKHVQVFINAFYLIIIYRWMKLLELFEAALFSVSFATKVINFSWRYFSQEVKIAVVNFCAWQVSIFFSVFVSGRCVQLVTFWTASDWALDHLHTYNTLTRHNAAIHRVTPTATSSVTMKMSPVRSTTRAGVNAKSRGITWLASTKAFATKFTALKSSDAARWRNVIFILFTLITN